MAKYVRIWNESELISSIVFEKLGISTKRDNDETIGQFGSGSKFAPILALRSGIDWITYAEDSMGPFRMEFDSRNVDGHDIVHFIYTRGDKVEVKESSYSTGAGEIGWKSGFQIFREAFCNAYDAHLEFGVDFGYEVVNEDEVTFRPGEVNIYLSYHPSIAEIIENFDKFFSIYRESTYEIETPDGDVSCKFLAKDFDRESIIFFRGVKVGDTMPFDKSLFDYELSNADLTEDRTLRDFYKVKQNLFDAFSLSDDREIHKAFFESRGDADVFENSVVRPYSIYSPSDSWVESFRRYFGPKSFPVNAEDAMVEDLKRALTIRGWDPIEISSSCLNQIFSMIEEFRPEKVLGDDWNLENYELNDDELVIFEKALSLVSFIYPQWDKIVKSVSFFADSEDGDASNLLGKASHSESTVLLNSRILTDPVLLYGTIVHEFDHVLESSFDRTDHHRHIADNHIGNLLVMLEEFLTN